MKILGLLAAVVVALASRAAAEPAVGLTTDNQLVRFDTATPATIQSTVAITGLQTGEIVHGIDFRPRTGGLYALGVVSTATDTLRLYRLNLTTGAATVVGTSIAGIPSGTFYGMDFNPTVDRIRVVNSVDVNLRINPNTGDSAANDTALNPASRLVDGLAYDRNFDGHLGGSGTTLYGLARSGAQLVTIGGVNASPSPNGGAVTAVGPLGVVISGTGGVGFDISVTGAAYAALTSTDTNHTGLYTIDLTGGGATLVGLLGDGTLHVAGLAIVPPARLVFGAEGTPTARVDDAATNVPGTPFRAFPQRFSRGVRVATGDLNRDGIPDVLLGASARAPSAVKIFDGLTGAFRTQLLAYELDFRGGVFVASGDVNGDGFDDVITAPGPGTPTEVRIYNGRNLYLLGSIFPFGNEFKGGATVAAADFDLDGNAEIVIGSGKGREADVRVYSFDGTTFTQFAVLPVPHASTKGVFVAAGSGAESVIVAGPVAGSAEVSVFKGAIAATPTFTLTSQFTAYPGPGKGARVALLDLNADGSPEIFAIPGAKTATCHVFDGTTGAELPPITPFTAKGGFVAAGR